MREQPLFFLVLLNEGLLISHWAFRADDELEVMRHLLRDPWSYQRLFRALRVDLQTIDELTPEKLLRILKDDVGSLVATRMTAYLIRVAASDICHVDPTNERTTV